MGGEDIDGFIVRTSIYPKTMNNIQKPWIEEGYRVLAHKGHEALKVERLAKTVGKNKSSFYHHFADLEVFTGVLLEYHLKQAYAIAEKESKAQSLEELIDIILEHKLDLLFNRQLRVYRDIPAFEACFTKVNAVSVPAILEIWAKIIGLEDHSYLAGLVLQLSLENFFLQITEKTLNREWLENYFRELQKLIRQFKKLQTMPAMNGSV